MHLPRKSLAVLITLAAGVAPAPALARGGGGSTPPPTTVTCDTSADGWISADEFLTTMPVKNAGCVSLIIGTSTIRLASVSPEPGWTYEVVSNGDGTNSRVDVKFENPTTGERAELRYEFGKTVVS